MKKLQSAVSWMRKQLGVKGKSVHSGRGSYECSVDIGEDKVLERVKNKIAKWEENGMIEEVKEYEEYLSVKLSKNFVDNSYRTFAFPKTKPAWMNANKNYYACLFSI
jgi:hypothetical protein